MLRAEAPPWEGFQSVVGGTACASAPMMVEKEDLSLQKLIYHWGYLEGWYVAAALHPAAILASLALLLLVGCWTTPLTIACTIVTD